MFKRRLTTPDGTTVDTLIGPQVTIHGDVHFSGGLCVEGRVLGRLVAADAAPAMLTIAEHGRVEGEVRVPVVVIHGALVGDAHASERIELAATAKVEGDLHYRVVEMNAGALLTGRLVHVAAPAAAAQLADGRADVVTPSLAHERRDSAVPA